MSSLTISYISNIATRCIDREGSSIRLPNAEYFVLHFILPAGGLRRWVWPAPPQIKSKEIFALEMRNSGMRVPPGLFMFAGTAQVSEWGLPCSDCWLVRGAPEILWADFISISFSMHEFQMISLLILLSCHFLTSYSIEGSASVYIMLLAQFYSSYRVR